MKSEHRKQYFVGIILLLAVVAFILYVFSMLCSTHKMDEYFMDTASRRYDWNYETLANGKVMTVTPEFLDEYTMILPGEPAEAVKITRTFTENLPFASIEMRIYRAGVEVFVGDLLIYSDFQGGERNQEGFLLLSQDDIEQMNESMERNILEKKVRISLPEDYTGKELAVITYFAEGRENFSPVYPFFGNDETLYAGYVTESVRPTAILTICAFFAVLVIIIFILDMINGKADWRILLLGVFFIFLFLGKAYSSLAGEVSRLSEYYDLSFLSELYIAPLYLYLALHLTKWRKYVLSGGVVLWFLYEGMQMILNLRRGDLILTGRNGLGALILFIAVAAAFLMEYICFGRKKKKGYYLFYEISAVAVSILCILYGSREWEGDVGMYLLQIVNSGFCGYFFSAVHLVANICGIMAVIILSVEFMHNLIVEREMISVLEERSHLTLEGYNRMLRAQESANSVKHEMRHHMTALTGILEEGDRERARTYIEAVTGELARLPVAKYSQNLLVNVIAGDYLERAKEEGIRTEYSLNVPGDLEIADEDLSVFLANMLENALHACERMKPDQERYIRVKMYMADHFLFIGCVNSRLPEQEEESENMAEMNKGEERRHGYGMEAMSRIAEKYKSILKVDQSAYEFSVKSNLCLKK